MATTKARRARRHTLPWTIAAAAMAAAAVVTLWAPWCDHYVVSETRDADGPAPIVFTYNLDPVSTVSIGLTMSCVGPAGR